MTGNMEQRVFDLLAQRAGVELCEACAAMRSDCDSVRQALVRLCAKGKAGIAHARRRVAFYFITRDAVRPIDGREIRWRK
jgi:hypothetical protein